MGSALAIGGGFPLMPHHTLIEILLKPPFLVALLLAVLVAGGAYGARLLTASGAISTLVVGVIVFGLGGGGFAIPLLVFFFTSSLLSKIAKARKAGANRGDAKGATRDAAQVWANGGIATAHGPAVRTVFRANGLKCRFAIL